MQNSLLLRNVYTYPETALALSPTGDQGMLLWVQPDGAKKVGQAHKLSFSRWNGAAWSNPTTVTDDLLLGSAPQLKWGNDGNVVAIWQRYFAAKVDPDNLIAESNETDNAAGTTLSTLYLPIATR
jgi:hypothetical protein